MRATAFARHRTARLSNTIRRFSKTLLQQQQPQPDVVTIRRAYTREPVNDTPFKKQFQVFQDRQVGDIIQNDLAATLAAHKASNENATYRAVKSSSPTSEHRALESESQEAAKSDKPVDFRINRVQLAKKPGKQRSKEQWRLETDALYARGEDQAAPGIQWEQEAGGDVLMYHTKNQARLRPWIVDHNDPRVSRKERLAQRIKSLSDFLSLSDLDLHLRKLLAQEVVANVKSSVEGVEFEMFGSQHTGLATYTSDIDIGFHLPSAQNEELDPQEPKLGVQNEVHRMAVIQKLKRMVAHFKATRNFGDIYAVKTARFPLVRMCHAASGVEFEFVSSPPLHAASRCLSKYLQAYPQAKPVFMILKAMLGARGLTDTRSGGAGSYTLILMIVAALKHSEHSRHIDCPLEALTQVLEFYRTFDSTQNCISIEPAQYFPKQVSSTIGSQKKKDDLRDDAIFNWQDQLSVVDEQRPWLLCLQDPADMTNDVGKHVRRYRQILNAFTKMSRDIDAWINDESNQVKHPFEYSFGSALGEIDQKRMLFHGWCRKIGQALREKAAAEQDGARRAIYRPLRQRDDGAEKSSAAKRSQWISLDALIEPHVSNSLPTAGREQRSHEATTQSSQPP